MATFHFDGEKQAEVDISGITRSLDSGYPTVIGTDGAEGTVWPAWFEGAIDEVEIYTYALDSFEIAQIYTSLSGQQACAETHPFDLTDDCRVNLDDFALIAETWMQCNEVPDCIDQHPY